MGDKGYYGDQDVEPPHKKPKGGSLTEEQIAQNIVHSCVLLFLSVLSFGQVVARYCRALHMAVQEISDLGWCVCCWLCVY